MSERGSVTLWMVGMMLVVLVVGGISIDLWRALSAHREVAAVVDSAAVAAGSGIDEVIWRNEGRLVLDPARVEARVVLSVGSQEGTAPVAIAVVTAPDGSEATVTGSTAVGLTLLGLVVGESIDISATATAQPALSP